MRRKSNEQTIQEVLKELVDSKPMKSKLTEVNLVNAWEQLVGPLIAKHTKKIYLSKGKLFLHIESPALKNELTYSRGKLIELVNQFAGEALIDEVIIR
jgi:hypothetical protein